MMRNLAAMTDTDRLSRTTGIREDDLEQELLIELASAADSPLPRTPVVLCVDDEPPILDALARLLRREPFELITSEDPREALDWFRMCRVDLLITDQRMPTMSGAELIRTVREISPATSCIMLTGFPDTEAVIEWRDGGIQRLITKPWENDTLRATVRRVLQDRQSRHGDDGGAR